MTDDMLKEKCPWVLDNTALVKSRRAMGRRAMPDEAPFDPKKVKEGDEPVGDDDEAKGHIGPLIGDLADNRSNRDLLL